MSRDSMVIQRLLVPDAVKLTKYFLMTYTGHNYDYEIVSGLKMIDNEFFKITKLFDWEVGLN